MNSFLKGKTVLITGASSGLGENLAHYAAKSEASVILIARNAAKLTEISARIERDYQVSTHVYPLDVTDFLAMEQIIKEILQAHDIDVLINCAGFGLFETAENTPFETVEAMFDTNVLGLIRLTQLFIPHFKEKRSGHIVNIASQAGKIATPKSSAYAATKFAVLGYSNALRMELKADNIKVTTVNPGPIATNFFDLADESGEYLKSVGFFVLKPEKVAEKTIRIIGKNRREVNLPFLMNIGTRIYQVMPSVVEFFGRNAFMKK
ncbi:MULTISPECIES: SDR family oxidoreductase [Listeria]|uniref:SDR family NAD(P)-dependent oxidoreductase n=1 Tax=Listeria TaxID=1637 RepID=UPI000B597145|nr:MULTISPECIES: SDR family oxidoreductase [Listeria]